MNTKCLCAAVELAIPDILREGPMTLEEVAERSSGRPDRLGQILRVLHNNGIFAYDASNKSYSHNSTSVLLLSDHWTQWRNWVDLYGNEFYDMARGIPAACRYDAAQTPAQINYDTHTDMFTYFTEQGWLPKLQKTLGGGAIAQAPGILDDYPWDEIGNGTILDLGGGGGTLIALLLRKYKSLRAGIFDLPKVIDYARTNFHDPNGPYADVSDRIAKSNLYAGDFLKEVPRFEFYTMKWCLHDWDDPQAIKILRNIRTAIIKGPRSRLVVLESILTDGHMGRLSRYADMNMFIAAGGQERNEAQWRYLARQTGWKIARICQLRNAWPCAIEFIPIWDAVVRDEIQGEETGSMGLPSTGGDQTHIATLSQDEHSSFCKEETSGPTWNYVNSQMRYLEPWELTRENPFIRTNPAEGYEYMNFKWMDYPVTVANARGHARDFNMDVQGFSFHSDPKGGTPELLNAIRSNERGLVRDQYYPHIEQLVKRVTGAPRVIIFDHTIRKRRRELGIEKNLSGKEQPATMVSPKAIRSMSIYF